MECTKRIDYVLLVDRRDMMHNEQLSFSQFLIELNGPSQGGPIGEPWIKGQARQRAVSSEKVTLVTRDKLRPSDGSSMTGTHVLGDSMLDYSVYDDSIPAYQGQATSQAIENSQQGQRAVRFSLTLIDVQPPLFVYESSASEAGALAW